MEQKKTFFIQTFGCQMNEHDSETLAGMLIEMGYEQRFDDKGVDLIVLNGRTDSDTIYGKAIVRTTVIGEGEDAETSTTVEVVYGDKSTGEMETAYSVSNGSYVAVKVKDGQIISLTPLGCLKTVSDTAWIGNEAVLHGGRSYSVSPDVLCYNKDSQEWVTLDAARAYSKTADLYVKDGVVHIIEVAYKN